MTNLLSPSDPGCGPAGRGDPELEAGDARKEGGGEGQAGGAGRARAVGGGEARGEHPGLEEAAAGQEGRGGRQAVSTVHCPLIMGSSFAEN